jgi:hypothetical protein
MTTGAWAQLDNGVPTPGTRGAPEPPPPPPIGYVPEIIAPAVLDGLCDATSGSVMGEGRSDVLNDARIIVEIIMGAVSQQYGGANADDCVEIDEDSWEGEYEGFEYEIEVEDLVYCENGVFLIEIGSAGLWVEGSFIEELHVEIEDFYVAIDDNGNLIATLADFDFEIDTTYDIEGDIDLDGFGMVIPNFVVAGAGGPVFDIVFTIAGFDIDIDGDDFDFEFDIEGLLVSISFNGEFEILLTVDDAELDLDIDNGIDLEVESETDDLVLDVVVAPGGISLLVYVEDFDFELDFDDPEFEIEINDGLIICDPIPNCVILGDIEIDND